MITEFPQVWGNKLLEGTSKTLCTPRPRRKEQQPHKRLIQTCLSVQESLAEAWVDSACCRVGAMNTTVTTITTTIVWPQAKQQGGNTTPPFKRKLDERFTEHGPGRRQWHPTPVLLPGKSHGWRSLVGCSPWSP